jgi:hypothetical protein
MIRAWGPTDKFGISSIDFILLVVYRQMKISGCCTRNQSEPVRFKEYSESGDAPEENIYENILANVQG